LCNRFGLFNIQDSDLESEDCLPFLLSQFPLQTFLPNLKRGTATVNVCNVHLTITVGPKTAKLYT